MAASLTFALLCVVASTISESDVVNAVSSKTVISLTSWTTAPTCGAKGTNDTGLIQQVGSCFVNEDDDYARIFTGPADCKEGATYREELWKSDDECGGDPDQVRNLTVEKCYASTTGWMSSILRCESSPPAGDHYVCVLGKCVAASKSEPGVPLKTCKDICKDDGKYKCLDNKCTLSATGASKTSCEEICGNTTKMAQ
eukprot:m.332235 g.332235  ORF g.332235 m.332235 type:complete len:198 (+) comp16905_c0_seq1:72-665(+)